MSILRTNTFHAPQHPILTHPFLSFSVWPLLPVLVGVKGYFCIWSHTHTHTHTHRVGRLLWTSDQPDAETSTWQKTTLTTDFHVLGGIRTHNPGKRVAADPLFRPRGHFTYFTYPKYVFLASTVVYPHAQNFTSQTTAVLTTSTQIFRELRRNMFVLLCT